MRRHVAPMPSARGAALRAVRTEPSTAEVPIDVAFGDADGLGVAIRWFDADEGLMAVSLLHAGAPVWSHDAAGHRWQGAGMVLDGLGAGMARAAGREGLGIAFPDAPHEGAPGRLRFEVVGEEIDVVSAAGRRRGRRFQALDALVLACDEIAARICSAGQDTGAPIRWALARPRLRRPVPPTLAARAA